MEIIGSDPPAGNAVMQHDCILKELAGRNDRNMLKHLKYLDTAAYRKIMLIQFLFNVLVRIPAGIGGTQYVNAAQGIFFIFKYNDPDQSKMIINE